MSELALTPRAVVAIGASAGGIEALSAVVNGLPPNLDAAVLVTVHIPPFAESTLPAILNRAGSLPAAQASDAEPLRPGRIYVAPPDRHLLVASGRVRVTRGPRENGHRPAVDALFRSTASTFGPATVGVVLSGNLDDGTSGLRAIKRAGGIAIVQTDAAFPDMPRSAMGSVAVDHAVELAAIADAIVAALASLPEPKPQDDTPPTVSAPFQAAEEPGPATEVTCPACGGVLTATGEEPMRFRCRVGHAYNLESLLVNQDDALEASLWTALRALEERGALLDRLASRFERRGNRLQAGRFAEDRDVLQERAALVRRALLDAELAEHPSSTSSPTTVDDPEDVAG